MNFKTRESAHTYALEQTRALKVAHGIERVTMLGTGWRVFMLPRPENRSGFELRCEAVEVPHE